MGQLVKTGTTGTQPEIKAIHWQGTAEVNVFYTARVPAAYADTTRGPMAIVKLTGTDIEGPRWWDARCVSSREWEDDEGNLIDDTRPELAKEIDAILATATEKHEQSRRDLHQRVMRKTFVL